MVHRDVKPANLLLDDFGSLKLIDFGIAELASVLHEEATDRSSLVGVGKPSGGFHKRCTLRAGPLNMLHSKCSARCTYLYRCSCVTWRQSHREVCCVDGVSPEQVNRRHMIGTLEYMAPECLLKAPGSPASDVYAWAVTVNELATGTFPFSDCTHDNPKAHTVLDMGYGRSVAACCLPKRRKAT